MNDLKVLLFAFLGYLAVFAVCGGFIIAEEKGERDPMVDLVKEGKVATLCTDYKGTPFGSLAPYALDENGDPLFYLSTLAVHTKNVQKNEKVSVMVAKVDKDDLFNSARVTFVGKLKKVPKDDVEKAKKAFFARHERAKGFGKFHDFDLYRVEIDKIYYIGGFGDIQWVEPKDYRKAFKGGE